MATEEDAEGRTQLCVPKERFLCVHTHHGRELGLPAGHDRLTAQLDGHSRACHKACKIQEKRCPIWHHWKRQGLEMKVLETRPESNDLPS